MMQTQLKTVVACAFVTLVSSMTRDDALKDKMDELRRYVQEMSQKIEEQNIKIEALNRDYRCNELTMTNQEINLLNNTSLEERVTLLEFQVAGNIEDISVLTVDVTDLQEDLTLVESEQIIQDERILDLEIDNNNLEDSVNNLISQDMQFNIELALVNNSVNEVMDLVEELTANLAVLEETMVELTNEIEQLKVNGTVAFLVDLNEYTSIPVDTVVLFDRVRLNMGNGYNSSTGEFTVPSGGAGLYFLYVNFWVIGGKWVRFDVKLNNSDVCKAEIDTRATGSTADRYHAASGALTILTEGDVVLVEYEIGTDDTPVVSGSGTHNTFNGFRIAPE